MTGAPPPSEADGYIPWYKMPVDPSSSEGNDEGGEGSEDDNGSWSTPPEYVPTPPREADPEFNPTEEVQRFFVCFIDMKFLVMYRFVMQVLTYV